LLQLVSSGDRQRWTPLHGTGGTADARLARRIGL